MQTTAFQKDSLVSQAETYAELATKPLGDAYILYKNAGVFQLDSIFQNTLKLNSTVPRIQVISVDGEVLYDTKYKGLSAPTDFIQERVTDPKLLKIIEGNMQTGIKDSRKNISEIISPYSDEFGGRPFSLRYFISYDSINAGIMQAIRPYIWGGNDSR
jgi:hypothetical protein